MHTKLVGWKVLRAQDWLSQTVQSLNVANVQNDHTNVVFVMCKTLAHL